jgi:uncharacterized protein YceH (UPF0502 family)
MSESNLDRTERRVIGTLVEKGFTVPDAYPLTLNALVAGCSQKSNRDPVLEVPEHHVEGALKALFMRGWIDRRSREGGRVTRWGHRVAGKLGVDDREMAVLAELLLRGPQTVGALRGRASRMTPFETTDEVLEVLTSLTEKHLVERLARRPGERGERWGHLLAPDEEREEEPAPPVVEKPPVERPEPAPAPAIRAETDRVDALEAEVRSLREEVEALRGDLRALRARLDPA